MVRLKLKEFLAIRGINRYRLAKMTGIKYQTYKNIVIRYDSLILSKICEVLQCEIWDILE